MMSSLVPFVTVLLLGRPATASMPAERVSLLACLATQGDWGDPSPERFKRRLAPILAQVNRCVDKKMAQPPLGDRQVIVSVKIQSGLATSVVIKQNENTCQPEYVERYRQLEGCIRETLLAARSFDGHGPRAMTLTLQVAGPDPVCRRVEVRKRRLKRAGE